MSLYHGGKLNPASSSTANASRSAANSPTTGAAPPGSRSASTSGFSTLPFREICGDRFDR